MKNLVLLIIIIATIVSCSNKKEEKKPLFPTNRKNSTKVIVKEKVAEKENAAIDDVIPKTTTTRKGNIKSIKVTATCSRKKPNKYYWDGNGAKPDLFGMIEFPNGQAIAFPLKVNSFTNTAYGENLTLNKGDTLKVVLLDKDISSAEIVAEGKFAYNGKNFFKKRIGSANFKFSIKKNKIK